MYHSSINNLNENQKQNQWGNLQSSESYWTRLALTPSSTSNVPAIFYFKHDVGVFNVLIFIGNPNVKSFSVVADVIPVLI